MTLTIGRPIWQLENAVGESSYFSGFVSKTKLAAENQTARDKIQQLEAEVLNEQMLKNENDQLKNILAYKATSSKMILTSILRWPPSSPYDTLIVDKGENEEVKVGARVFASGNLALGEVAETHQESSMVRLFSATGEKWQVSIVGSSTLAATALGRGGSNFLISLPAGSPVEINDLVILPGSAPVILGKVEKIETLANDSFMSVFFKLPVNIQSLRYLEIVQ